MRRRVPDSRLCRARPDDEAFRTPHEARDTRPRGGERGADPSAGARPRPTCACQSCERASGGGREGGRGGERVGEGEGVGSRAHGRPTISRRKRRDANAAPSSGLTRRKVRGASAVQLGARADCRGPAGRRRRGGAGWAATGGRWEGRRTGEREGGAGGLWGGAGGAGARRERPSSRRAGCERDAGGGRVEGARAGRRAGEREIPVGPRVGGGGDRRARGFPRAAEGGERGVFAPMSTGRGTTASERRPPRAPAALVFRHPFPTTRSRRTPLPLPRSPPAPPASPRPLRSPSALPSPSSPGPPCQRPSARRPAFGSSAPCSRPSPPRRPRFHLRHRIHRRDLRSSGAVFRAPRSAICAPPPWVGARSEGAARRGPGRGWGKALAAPSPLLPGPAPRRRSDGPRRSRGARRPARSPLSKRSVRIVGAWEPSARRAARGRRRGVSGGGDSGVSRGAPETRVALRRPRRCLDTGGQVREDRRGGEALATSRGRRGGGEVEMG